MEFVLSCQAEGRIHTITTEVGPGPVGSHTNKQGTDSDQTGKTARDDRNNSGHDTDRDWCTISSLQGLYSTRDSCGGDVRPSPGYFLCCFELNCLTNSTRLVGFEFSRAGSKSFIQLQVALDCSRRTAKVAAGETQ